MIKNRKQYQLRALLFAGAFGWGVSILGIFLPWDLVLKGLYGLGAENIAPNPMLDYWFRMATGAFSIIGFFFFVAACWPEKYRNIIPLLGGLSIFEGIVLLIHGLRLGIGFFPFSCDVAFCLFVGIGVLVLAGD
jgi:hypothetical protein